LDLATINFLTFALIFFFGTLISGSQAIATICKGVAFLSLAQREHSGAQI